MRGVEVVKQGDGLEDPDASTAYSIHVTAGIPLCTPAQAIALDPNDRCSAGPINVFASGLSELPEYGAESRAGRALLSGWEVSFISQTFSAPLLETILVGLDIDGDGISRTLLPGTEHYSFGAGHDEAGLRELVDRYIADVDARARQVRNADGSVSIIRPRTPANQIITPNTLPDELSHGDSFLTQDVRVTRKVRIGDHVVVSLIGEVFHLFNIANLTGFGDMLSLPSYGQPGERAAQVFGTGGPCSVQFAARLTF